MKYNRLIGNIFVVDSKLNVNSILWAAAKTIATAMLLFIYESEPITMNISLKSFIYVFAGEAIISVLEKRKVFKNFFTLYFFKSSFQTLIPYIIAEFLIFISLIFVGRIIDLTNIYLLAVLFLISGFQRIIIQKTKALFFADISEYMDFIQVYGHVRASYFALAIFFTLETIKTLAPHMFVFDSIVFKVALLAIIFRLEIQFISNLCPYCEKHKDIENTILIIREIAKNKHIKINEIGSCIGVPNNFVNKQFLELVDAKYIVKRKKKSAELDDEYKKIYTNGS